MLVAPMNSQSSTAQSPAFPNTRWSVVLAATQRETPGAAGALDERYLPVPLSSQRFNGSVDPQEYEVGGRRRG